MSVRIPALITVLAILQTVPTPSHGGGILHTFSPALKDEVFAVARPGVMVSKTLVTVSESSIEYKFDQTFVNDNDLPLEGSYLFPLPDRAELSELDVRVDGAATKAKIVTTDRFFPILKTWISNSKDPTLLELAGKDILMIRSVYLGPHQQKSFHLSFKTPISIENDQLDLFVTLAGERYALGPVGTFEIIVRSKMDRPIRTVFSPTHHIMTLREAPHRCLVTLKSIQSRVRSDFRLLMTYSWDDPDFKVFTHRSGAQKGAFAVFIEPPLTEREIEKREADIVFVLDRSGSIGTGALEQAKRAVIFGLEKLSGGDRFNVLTIGSHVGKLADRLMESASDNIAEAVRFVNATESEGGTDLYNGIMTALEQFTSLKRFGIIIFAGDGRPTVGVTDPEVILEDIKRNNRFKARIYVLASGKEADIALLDRMAISSRGALSHFSAKENFPIMIKEFFAKISPPIISQLTLTFPKLAVEDVAPERLPDLGQEGTIVLGRYRGKDDAVSTVRLEGRIGGRIKTVSRNCLFPRQSASNSYIQRLWAMRRVAALSEKELLRIGEPKEREQLSALAKEYGFRLPLGISPEVLPVTARAARQKNSGELLWRFKTSNVAADVLSDSIKDVNEKSFRFENGAWVDTLYQSSMPARTVQFLSDEYFDLVKANVHLGAYFSLGPQVTVVLDQVAIKVVSKPQVTP
jgi:Ca-activated chloride channel family protein